METVEKKPDTENAFGGTGVQLTITPLQPINNLDKVKKTFDGGQTKLLVDLVAFGHATLRHE